MSRLPNANRLNLQALAQDGAPVEGGTPLQKMARLADETLGLTADASVAWQARAELRPQSGAEDQVWLHLHADAEVPLACQRCMTRVVTPIQIDQWYRFVATEDIALAEDDESEEDLLVMEPQFDLESLIEDELLMALPIVPLHDVCPVPVEGLQAAGAADAAETAPKANPFAVLAQLKSKK